MEFEELYIVTFAPERRAEGVEVPIPIFPLALTFKYDNPEDEAMSNN